MEKFFHNKIDIIFWAVSIALVLFLLAYIIYAVAFLSKKAGSILGYDLPKTEEVVKFNLEKAAELR